MSAGEQSGMRAALEQVASELETWAIQREKNVMLLDLRGARRARFKVDEIRTLLASAELTEADVADVVATARALMTLLDTSPPTRAHGRAGAMTRETAPPATDDPFAAIEDVYDAAPPTTRARMLPDMEDSGPINFKRLLAGLDEELARQEARGATTRRPPPPVRPTTLVSRDAQRADASSAEGAGTRRKAHATIEEAMEFSPEEVLPYRDTLRDLVAPLVDRPTGRAPSATSAERRSVTPASG